MNRKSFIGRIAISVAALFGWQSSKAAAAKEPRALGVTTGDYSIMYVNSANVERLIVDALQEVSDIIKTVHEQRPGLRVVDVQWRNILHKDCNPDGKVGFFRVLFFPREAPTQSAYMAYCYPLKDLPKA